MGYRYILIVDSDVKTADANLSLMRPLLRGMGLGERFSSCGTTLFTSAETPTVRTPDGGIVFGHVFLRDGTPLGGKSCLPDSLSSRSTRSFLLERCWGEYLLIQPGQADASQLSITRDPSGGVACVYEASRGVNFFTSDVSIATQLGLYGRQLNWDFIAHFLTHTYVKTERTGLAGIRELLPGCTLHLHGNGPSVEQAWSPWDFVAPERRQSNRHDAATQLRTIVETTIKSWAGVDKSVLVELSGGLDSSIVAACLKGTRAKTVCATLVPALPGADERQYAEAMALALGVKLHVEELSIESARFDASPPPSSVIPGYGLLQHAVNHVMEAVADREGVHCFYSGGGGDTVFSYLGGAAPAADAFKERGFAAGIHAIRNLSELHQCTIWRASRLTFKKLTSAPSRAHPASIDLLNSQAIVGEPDRHPWFDAPMNVLPGDLERVIGLAGTQMFKEGLPRGLERCMRLPLLSQPVMEVCLSVPTWMSIAEGRNRSVARSAFSDILPRNVLDRRSKGDFAQYNGAVYLRNKDRMRDFLLEGKLQAHHLLNRDAIGNLFDRPFSPRDRSFMRIFELCRVENWVRHQS